MRTDRLLKIIYTCLQRQRVTIGELAERLEVSRRTIFRDLEALSAAGIPVVTYPGAGGGVGIMEGFALDRSLLTDDDFARLATALAGMQSVDGNRDVELLLNKLIPADKRGAGGGDIIIDLSSWFEGDAVDEMFADLRAAIREHRCVELAYSTRGMFTQRLVEPYKLVFKYQSWYLYAYCRLRGGFRMFKLTRVSRYEVTAERFDPRELGRLVFHLEDPGGREEAAEPAEPVEVVLGYAAEDREHLMDKLGPQSFAEADGRGTVRFATTNLPWVADLVMGLQDKAEVLAPPWLREEVRRRIEKMCGMYKGDS